MISGFQRYRWDEIPLEKVTDMVACKAIATSRGTITQAYHKKGSVVPRHEHSRDTVLYILQGVLRVHLAGAERLTLREGDVLVVPAHTAHETESLDDTFLMTFI